MDNKITQKYIQLTHTGKQFLDRDCGLMSYYNDIRGYNVLSANEIKRLFGLYHNGTSTEKEYARDKIFKHNTKLVVAVAKLYCRQEDNLLDLIEEGNIGLLAAIDRYDVNNSASFAKYAMYWIRREINNFKYDITAVVRKTNNIKTATKLNAVTEKLSQKLCRKPTEEEILDEYNSVNTDCIIYNKDEVFDVDFFHIDGAYTCEDDYFTNKYKEFENATSSDNLIEDDIDTNYNKKLIAELLPCLNSKEKIAITMLYGLETGIEASTASVATKLGCSTEYVRQLNIKGLEKLKKASIKLNLDNL
jgi:RNA polymerase sigma factor (sigma-70 family)